MAARISGCRWRFRKPCGPGRCCYETATLSPSAATSSPRAPSWPRCPKPPRGSARACGSGGLSSRRAIFLLRPSPKLRPRARRRRRPHRHSPSSGGCSASCWRTSVRCRQRTSVSAWLARAVGPRHDREAAVEERLGASRQRDADATQPGRESCGVSFVAAHTQLATMSRPTAQAPWRRLRSGARSVGSCGDRLRTRSSPCVSEREGTPHIVCITHARMHAGKGHWQH
mmetsp:Transcript_6374/g.14750  ORF Transcript_6374/g.14750 Transcript_6374/m.14750 type:complete len:228 (+) Transcript_6374:429-1112(+)